LTERGFAAAAVHGDLGQSQRERALRAFRSGKIDVLVATDVAARGLDVDDVTHVVNYECPEDEKAYLHRTGRTGRAGRTGVAVTFVDWQDMARWKLIDAALKLGQPEPLETYSTSPHLYSALAIPEVVTGALPAVQRERAGLHAEALEDIGETGKHRSRQRQRESQGHGRKPRDGQSASGDTGQRGASQAKARSGQEEATAVVKRSRRRTRGGAPIKPAAEPAAHVQAQEAATAPESVMAPDATRTGLPRRRRKPSRSATRGPGTGHGQDGQSSSTRPASRAEHRDIASD
jgi:superfamily II DNA/RNA helicase